MIEFNGSEIVINERVANDIMDFVPTISDGVLSSGLFQLAPLVMINDNGDEVGRFDFKCRSETPSAYIVTDNRGKRYLVFAGSVEHDNAVMFNYEIKPLYE